MEYTKVPGEPPKGSRAASRSGSSRAGSMKVLVISRDGNKELVKGGLDVPDEASVKDLKSAIHQRAPKYYPSRQRLTLPQKPDQKPVALADSKRLSDYFQGSSNAVVVFKDLGPQVYYRTLFFFEYLGPLLIYPIFYLFPQVYALFGLPAVSPGHPAQKIAFYYWSLHYFKRILETFFVHKFSHATSPLSNVFRNGFYYSLFAALISYCINHPLYKPVPETQALLGFGFGLVCQLANLYCHILLSSLRPSDGKGGYQIPRGFLFEYITCANYTTEIYQWIGFNFATRVKPGYIFLLIGTMFMTNWAIGKHRRLNKLYDGRDGRPKYPKRWVFLPPFF